MNNGSHVQVKVHCNPQVSVSVFAHRQNHMPIAMPKVQRCIFTDKPSTSRESNPGGFFLGPSKLRGNVLDREMGMAPADRGWDREKTLKSVRSSEGVECDAVVFNSNPRRDSRRWGGGGVPGVPGVPGVNDPDRGVLEMELESSPISHSSISESSRVNAPGRVGIPGRAMHTVGQASSKF
jgi:hypothetical protein